MLLKSWKRIAGKSICSNERMISLKIKDCTKSIVQYGIYDENSNSRTRKFFNERFIFNFFKTSFVPEEYTIKNNPGNQ